MDWRSTGPQDLRNPHKSLNISYCPLSPVFRYHLDCKLLPLPNKMVDKLADVHMTTADEIFFPLSTLCHRPARKERKRAAWIIRPA